MTYRWNWKVQHREKYGQPVTVALANDGTGRLTVTFSDGSKTRVMRWAVKKDR
jgi:hypothetical protein